MALSEKERKGSAEDLASDGSIRKTVLTEGEGEQVGRGAKVTIKYSMRLAEDKASDPFDSSEKRKGGVLQFTLGKRKVIPALEIVAQSMKLGEKCDASATAPYAFGNKGLRRKGVPPKAKVYLQVELVAQEGGEKVKAFAEMSPFERFEEAQRCKESGNQFFKELKYEKAMSQYSQCIRHLSNVFYKPSSSLSDAAAKPVVNATAEPKELSPSPPEATKPDQGTAGTEESQQNGPNEEGFAEAEIVEESNSAETQNASEVVEEVTTIDISTSSHGDSTTTATATSTADSNRGNETTSGDKPVVESSSSEPQNQGAEREKKDNDHQPSENDDPEENEVVTLHVTTLNNLALCLVKLEDYKRAVETASHALTLDPSNYKAMYYRGRAQIAIGDWDKARSDLVAAAKIQPNNIGIRMEIQKLDKKKKQFEEKEKKQAAAMFA